CNSTNISPVDPEAAELRLGAGEDGVERVQEIARLRDPVGVPRYVEAQRTVDTRRCAQRPQRDDAPEVHVDVVPTTVPLPVGPRLADVPRNGATHARARAGAYLRPGGECLVEPRI